MTRAGRRRWFGRGSARPSRGGAAIERAPTIEGPGYYRAVLELLSEGVLVQDTTGRVLYANDRARDLLPPASGKEGLVVVDATGVPMRPTEQPGRTALREGRSVEDAVIGLRDGSGQVRWLEVSSHPMVAADGAGSYAVVSSIRDITDRRDADDLLAVKARLLDSVGQAVVAWDTSGLVTFVNANAEELYGVTRSDAVGQLIVEVIDVDPVTNADQIAAIAEATAAGEPWEGEVVVGRPGRPSVAVWTTNTPILSEGRVLGHIGVSKDITDEKAAAARLDRMARHDGLTGLPNRQTLVDLVDARLAGLRPEQVTSVVLVDLGTLDLLNDAFNHATGDAVVLRCAGRLQQVIHAGDGLARFSDHTFGISCSHEPDGQAAAAYAERLRAALSEPLEVEGTDVHLPASASVVTVHPGTCGAEELIRRADTALSRARRERSTRVYDDSMQAEILRQLHLDRLIDKILASGTIRMGYQPLVRLSDQTIVGAEALLRVLDGEDPVPPLELVAAAERTGRIGDLGELILRTACIDAATWPRAWSGRPVAVSVNLSARQLSDRSLAQRVEASLAASGLAPWSLCLEITESALMDDPAWAIAQLEALRASGIRFAADDFGTGYSSLAYLKALPLDALKIDRSFVAGLPDSLEDLAITQAILSMSDALGLSVTAEGIETDQQFDVLLELGTGFGQGYLWGKAMSTEAFAAAIRAENEDAGPTPISTVSTAWRIRRPTGGEPSAERVDTTLAIIAHEFRSPGGVVTGYANLLAATLTEDDADAAAAIDRAAERIDRILADLVDLTGEAAALGTGTLQVVDAAAVAREVLDDRFPSREITLRVPGVSSAAGPIMIDRARFAQVLTNLLTNADESSPRGSPIEVVVSHAGGWVDIAVADRGPGVSADDLGLIFRRYGRIDPFDNGTGLGLYLARQIAWRQGGDVRSRHESIGSILVVRLPAAPTDPEAPMP